MAEHLRSGDVDFIIDSAFPQLKLYKKANTELIASEERSGGYLYSSIIIVRKDSNLTSLADLAGKTIAFEDENSTPSYALPKLALQKIGLSLTTATPNQKQVAYVFGKQEINITKWVHSGRVDAGALSDSNWNSRHKVPKNLKEELKIIYESDPYPRGLVAISKHVPEKQASVIRDVFGGTPMTDEDLAALRDYRKLGGYDRLDEQDLAQLFKLLDALM